MRKTLMAAAAAIVGSVGIASAADLGGYGGSTKDEPYAYAPITWSGLYVGVHAGGAWADVEVTDADGYNAAPGRSFGFDDEGFIGGAQIGYNWQRGAFVLGVEAELGYLGLDNSRQDPVIEAFGRPDSDSNAKFESDLYGTLAARLGYAHGSWLVYAKGGAAFLNADASFSDTFPTGATLVSGTSQSETLAGWVVGGGIEYAMAGGWSMKVEYLHFDFEDMTVNAVDNGGRSRSFDFDTEVDTVKVGLNYKIGSRDEPLK